MGHGPHRLLIILASALVASLMGCAVPVPTEVEPTIIEFFRASKEEVARGESIELSWRATGVAIVPGGSGCSLVRQVAGEQAGSPRTVSCEGGSVEAVEAAAPAASVHYELRALALPVSTVNPYVTASLSIAILDPSTPDPREVLVSLSPEVAHLAAGQSQVFTAEVTGAEDTSVTWAATGGQVVGDGSSIVFLAPDQPGEYLLTATSVEDPSRAASATITVAQVGISIDRTFATLLVSTTQAFTATVEGASDRSVSWATTCGSIDGLGPSITFLAPGFAATCTVRAYSVAAPEVMAQATVLVEDVSLFVSPISAWMAPGQSRSFTAAIEGTSRPELTWSVTGGSLEVEGATAEYTAPMQEGSFWLTASSVAYPSVSAEALIQVANPSITIDPASVFLVTGESRSFSATVTGAGSAAVTWSTTGGSVSGSGATVTYQAPASGGDHLLTATSVSVPGLSASAFISVAEVGVTIVPSSVRLYPGETQSFTASVSGAPGTGVSWSTTCGSLSGVGTTVTFHAPAVPIDCILTATSLRDPSRGATAVIEVAAAPSGDRLWTRTIATVGGEEQAAGIAVDADGGAVVVGSTTGSLYAYNPVEWDAFIVRYDAAGVSLWRRQIGLDDRVQAVDVAFDRYGDIIVVLNVWGDLSGQTNPEAQGVHVAKLDSDGNWLWQTRFGTPEGTMAAAVTTDPEGHIVIVGNTSGQLGSDEDDGQNDAYAAKLTSQGDVLWTYQWGEVSYDNAVDVATDAEGNIYVAGNQYVSARFVKLDADGVHHWTMNPFPYEAYTSARGVSVGPDGGIVVAGDYSSPSSGQGRGVVAKFDTEGGLIWRQQFGPADGAAITGVAVGPDESVTFVGRTVASIGGADPATPAFLAKFTPAGGGVWARHIESTLVSAFVAVDPAGNAWVWGTTRWPEGHEPGPSGYEYDTWLGKFLP